jgi:hypothetical protein
MVADRSLKFFFYSRPESVHLLIERGVDNDAISRGSLAKHDGKSYDFWLNREQAQDLAELASRALNEMELYGQVQDAIEP